MLIGCGTKGVQPQKPKKISQREKKRKNKQGGIRHQKKVVTQAKLRTSDGEWDLERVNYEEGDHWGMY